jgi:1,2-diacylglycerol 3-beta-galactosyltransferase
MKRIIFLMSDTGGGHRAAGRAIEAALNIRYPDEFEVAYVDVFREYTPPPMKYAPEIYPRWVKHSIKTYGWYFQFFDQLMQLPLARSTLPTLVAEDVVKKLMSDYKPDVIVVLHGAFSRFIVGARQRLRLDVPIITVITDMAKPHVAWYHPGVDRCLVPCEAAYTRGIKLGIPASKLRIVGHPAHPKFALYTGTKQDARAELNWAQDLPAVMLVGGGDGMGTMADIALEINKRNLDMQLAIICGRNEELRDYMQSITWNQQTYVYGFVRNMEVMMRGADVLITKAGPGTIAEAAISELPMIINDAIPYQESPNADFVVANEAGIYEPDAAAIASTLAHWFNNDRARLDQIAHNVSSLAYPNATFDIAEEIKTLSQKPAGTWAAASPNVHQANVSRV